MDINHQVLILAGGLGTRLRAAVPDRPKCMALIADRPFLEYLILKFRKDGFEEFIISTGYRSDLVREHFEDGSRLGVDITYSPEDEPLGTAGAIRHAAALIRGAAFLVANGDSLLDIDARTLLSYHEEKSALVTLALTDVRDAARYGTVELTADGAIGRIAEKSSAPVPGLINGGIYVFSREVLNEIPDGRKLSLETEVLPGFVGRRAYGLVARSWFIDIGTPEDYERLRRDRRQLQRIAGVAEC